MLARDPKGHNGQPWLINVTGGTPLLTYVSGTVPADKVVNSVEYSQLNVTLIGEVYRGGREYTPSLKVYGPVSGAPVTVSLSTSGDHYTFSQAITLTGPGNVMLMTDDGGQHVVTFSAQASPPEISGLQFKDVYPVNTDPLAGGQDTQTAVKHNDNMYLTGTLDVAAARIKVPAYEATVGQGTQIFNGPFSAGAFEIYPVLMGTGNGTLQHCRAYAETDSGTPGSIQTTSNYVEKDQDGYAVPDPALAYPAGQSAVKNSETCTATAVVSGYPQTDDSILYDDITGTPEFTVVGSTTYAAAKVWTRTAGNYRETGNNVRIRAWKAKNGLLTARYFKIRIAHVAPLLTVTHTSKLRSQVAVHTITGTSNQYIADGVPDSPDGRPVLQASGGSLGSRSGLEGTVWTWPLTINDGVANGQYDFTLTTYKNRANLEGSIQTGGGEDDTYDVGGFESRDVVGVAFQEHFAIGKAVDVATNVTCERVGVGSLVFTSTPSPPEPGKFSLSLGVDGYNANGTHAWWLDDAQRDLGLVETMRVEETI